MPDAGFIKVDNKVWLDTGKKSTLKPQKRNIGFVFQDYTLFPNMNIRENLEYALGKNKSPQIITEVLDVLELAELQYYKSRNISGGQKQRVALARAVVRKPRLLLLDEPLSALDNEMRFKLQEYILKIHKQYNLTTIMVSHNLADIYTMAGKVFKLDNGKINTQILPYNTSEKQTADTKLQITGTVLKIEQGPTISVLIGNTTVKISITEKQAQSLTVGHTLLVNLKMPEPVNGFLD